MAVRSSAWESELRSVIKTFYVNGARKSSSRQFQAEARALARAPMLPANALTNPEDPSNGRASTCGDSLAAAFFFAFQSRKRMRMPRHRMYTRRDAANHIRRV